MTETKQRTAGWAVKLIIAIVCGVIALIVQMTSPGSQIAAAALLVCLIALVWGAIEYLLTKKRQA